MNVLVINAGSSSLKYQLMNPETGDVSAKGLCERIYIDGRLTHKVGDNKVVKDIPMPSHSEAIAAVLDILVDPVDGVIKSVDEIDAVGHRVLHGGMEFSDSCIIDDAVIAAIEKCATYETTLLAERRIMGRELTVSYLGGEVLPAVEIIPLQGFYDYENKYQAGMTTEICPAPLTEAETAALAEATRKGFEALRLRGYSRFDFILDENGTPWCLEANTLPGMTPTSLLPQAAAAAGISYDELCERMVMMAVRGKA